MLTMLCKHVVILMLEQVLRLINTPRALRSQLHTPRYHYFGPVWHVAYCVNSQGRDEGSRLLLEVVQYLLEQIFELLGLSA